MSIHLIIVVLLYFVAELTNSCSVCVKFVRCDISYSYFCRAFSSEAIKNFLLVVQFCLWPNPVPNFTCLAAVLHYFFPLNRELKENITWTPTSCDILHTFHKSIASTKRVYVSKTYYHTSLKELRLSVVDDDTASQIRTSAVLLFLIRKLKITDFGIFVIGTIFIPSFLKPDELFINLNYEITHRKDDIKNTPIHSRKQNCLKMISKF
jgi:hypothetical protein